jgi:hypothetical protein
MMALQEKNKERGNKGADKGSFESLKAVPGFLFRSLGCSGIELGIKVQSVA